MIVRVVGLTCVAAVAAIILWSHYDPIGFAHNPAITFIKEFGIFPDR